MGFGTLKLILGAVLFFSLFLTVFSFVAYGQTKFDLFSWMGSLCLLLNLIWMLGIMAIFK